MVYRKWEVYAVGGTSALLDHCARVPPGVLTPHDQRQEVTMKEQKDPVCPSCNGTGRVRAESVARRVQKDPACPNCNGTGRVHAEDDAASIKETEDLTGGHQ